MDEKIIVKSRLKNIIPSCVIVGMWGPLLLILASIQSIYDYLGRGNERTFADALDYTFGGGNGAMMVFEPLAVLTILIAIILYRCWSKVELTVTNKRVYGRTSTGKRVDLPLDSVSAIGLQKSTIAVTTASGALKFTYLANAQEIHSAVSDLLVERQKGNAAPTAAAEQSSADELKKYKELLDTGVISQEEFDAKKKQLLNL